MNRRPLIALSAAFLMSAWTAAAPAGSGVNWAQPPFDDVLETAKQQDKHVFIDFYATWCGPCKKLDKVTYQDANVVEYLNSIVAVKYDAEKGEGEELAGKFRVKAYPTLVLLGPDGREIDRYVGYLDGDGFIETIKGYQEGVGTVAYYEALLDKNPDDQEALYSLGVKHAEAVRPDQAETMFERLLELDPDHENRAEIFFQLGYAMASDDRNEEAVDRYNVVINDYPDSEIFERAVQMQARAYYALDQKDECLDTYQVLLDRHPEDAGVLNGFAWFCAQRKIGFDRALPVALKAVELSERDPGVLDTLAELYYAMGDYDHAIEVGKEAAALEPDDQYFKDQLDKFRKAADDEAS